MKRIAVLGTGNIAQTVAVDLKSNGHEVRLFAPDYLISRIQKIVDTHETFWVLFAVWPILWLRDHRRSKTLWAEETAVLLAPNPQQSASDSSADAQGGIALPVILGHERESSGEGILIPMLGWEAAFPTLEPKRMGLHLVAADTLPGVHLPALDAGDLLAFSGWNQSAQSFGASEDDWQAARRWTEHLRTVLAGKVF